MQPDENNTIKKWINYFVNIISILGGIITILSFYGYNNTRQLTFIILGTLFIILTIFIFVNRNKISQRLEIKYRKFNKQANKTIKMQYKLSEENLKLLDNFYEAYDKKSIYEILDYINYYGNTHDRKMAEQFKSNYESANLGTEDILMFNNLYYKYKNIFHKDTN